MFDFSVCCCKTDFKDSCPLCKSVNKRRLYSLTSTVDFSNHSFQR